MPLLVGVYVADACRTQGIFVMNMEDEIWKDIPDYEGLYQVSNLGRVLSLPRHKPTDKRETHNNIRKQRLSPNGYWRVNLSKNNKVKWHSVHRLVAMAFIPNPDNLPCVNHKDENSQNNVVGNLEWCTIQYNCEYGTARERQRISRANNPNDKYIRKLVGEKNGKPIRCFTPNGTLHGIYKSLTEASIATKVNITTIIRHCKGKVGNNMNRPIRKFRFEYAEN